MNELGSCNSFCKREEKYIFLHQNILTKTSFLNFRDDFSPNEIMGA